MMTFYAHFKVVSSGCGNFLFCREIFLIALRPTALHSGTVDFLDVPEELTNVRHH